MSCNAISGYKRRFPFFPVVICGIAGLVSRLFPSPLPALSMLALEGSGRGVALVLKADRPFVVSGTIEIKRTDAERFLLLVHVPECMNGLSENQFVNFEKTWGISQVAIRRGRSKRGLDILLDVRFKPDENPEVKLKGERILVRLSSDRSTRFAWNTSETEKRADGAGEAHFPRVCLEDIRIIHRGDIEQLQLDFDGMVTPRIKRERNRMTLLFEMAANCLDRERISVPEHSVFSSVELRQRRLNGKDFLGVVITLNGEEPGVVSLNDRGEILSLFVHSARKERYALWSALQGDEIVVDFDIHDDLPHPEQRPAASTDTVDRTVTTRSSVSRRTMVTTGNHINVRTGPAAGGHDNIIGRLDSGMVVDVIGQQGDWYEIATESLVGWVSNAFLEESAVSAGEVDKNEYESPPKVSPQAASVIPSGTLAALSSIVAVQPREKPKRQTGGERGGQSVLLQEQEAGFLPAQEIIRYRRFGRDPFTPFLREEDSGLPNVENLELVGILYDENERLALLENFSDREKAYILREQDPVEHGTVLKIGVDQVTFLITELGISRSFVLKLQNIKTGLM